MKLLFDQNLSPFLSIYFKDAFKGSLHLQDIGLDVSDDLFVWEYAGKNDFTIVTKFNNLIALFGFPPKVIWIRRGNCTTKLIKEIISEHIDVITAFINDTENGILSIF
jgi:predicted nuclease of predicted toxin-antitoxin system